MKISNVSHIDKAQEVQKAGLGSDKSVNQSQNRIEKHNQLDVEKEVHKVMTEEMMKKSVNQANKALKKHNRRIDRSVHEVTKTVMYKMIDTETDEVIREFPPKKIQDMIAKMWELAGLFVDEEV